MKFIPALNNVFSVYVAVLNCGEGFTIVYEGGVGWTVDTMFWSERVVSKHFGKGL